MRSNIQDYLKRIPFLNKVPSKRLDMLGEMSRFEILGPGTDVITEGERGDKVYVVLFGNLVVTALSGINPNSNDRRKLVLAELHIGECNLHSIPCFIDRKSRPPTRIGLRFR